MSGALYQQVFEALRDDIQTGRFAVGERLPSDAALGERFGVSAITLKRALELLKNDGYISRRARVGTFVISDVATSSASGYTLSHPLVGLVVTNFDDTFGVKVLAGVLDQANTSINLIIKRSLGDESAEDQLIRALFDSGVRALILQPSSSVYVPAAVLELITQNFPMVILDRVFEGVPISTVCSDNVTGGQLATEHLMSLGHEHIGLVTSSSTVTTLEDRRTGFVKAFATMHVPQSDGMVFTGTRSTTPGSSATPQQDIEQLSSYLVSHPQLTAAVATEYNIALMLREAAHRVGRSVPDDLSIVCFDHPDDFYDTSQFRFTHIRQDQERMGREAVDLANQLMRQPNEVHKVGLPVELIIGASTRPI
ncbi:GntR family transcriptional regulator [Microlunatus ginsengisoli]|uniref:GntR family transcriptional regulator n=1 Tax=Microlunatus ginsengisoli TaxID=363863 RepID=A0ABP7AME3_9ACTN